MEIQIQEGETVSASLEIVVTGLVGRSLAKAETPIAVPSPGGEGQDEGGRQNKLNGIRFPLTQTLFP
jgi:hypothetical protein